MTTFMTVLIAVIAGFIAGWAAHRSEKRAYAMARERFKADQLAAELWACQQELALAEADVEAARSAPATAGVHLHLPALPPGWPQSWTQPPLIDALPVSSPGREIPQ